MAKELLTAYADDIKGMSPVEWVRFAANFAGERCSSAPPRRDDHGRPSWTRREDNEEEGSLFNRGTQVKMFEDREEYMLAFGGLLPPGLASRSVTVRGAFDALLDHVLHTAQAYPIGPSWRLPVAGIGARVESALWAAGGPQILGLVAATYTRCR